MAAMCSVVSDADFKTWLIYEGMLAYIRCSLSEQKRAMYL